MAVRYYFAALVLRAQRIVNVAMTAFLLFVFLGIFFFEKAGSGTLTDYFHLILPTFLLNVISMFAGYFLALKAGIENRGRYTIASNSE
jgi:predicted Na+-dependent transporter